MRITGNGNAELDVTAPAVISVEDAEKQHVETNLLPILRDALVCGPLIPRYRNFLRVLFADPDVEVTNRMFEFLTMKGCEVRTTTAGSEALGLLSSDSFDIAFIDFNLPVIDGVSVIKQITETLRIVAPSKSVSSGRSYIDESSMSATMNPHLLLVGMDTYPSAREDQADRLGMHVFCPKPLDLVFVSNILSSWRLSETVEDALKEIKSAPPKLMELQREESTVLDYLYDCLCCCGCLCCLRKVYAS